MKKMSILLLFAFIYAGAFGQITATEWYNKARKFQGEKSYPLAIDLFKKAVAADNNFYDAWYQMGWCQNELKKYNDAILSLTHADQLKPGMVEVNFELGYAKEYTGTYDDAVFYYRKCITVNPNYASAWYHKGWCENQLGVYDSSYQSCSKAIAGKTGYREAYDELGYACYKLKRNEEAIDAYRKSITIDSTRSSAYNGLGDIFKSNYKNYDSAIYYFSKAMEKNPEHKKAPYSIGWCYNEKSMFEQAIPFLKKAIAIDANYIAAKTELGYAHYKLKNYDDALVQFTQIINSDSKDELSRYYGGFCYYLKNDQYGLKKMIDQLQNINTTSSLQYVETLKKYIK